MSADVAYDDAALPGTFQCDVVGTGRGKANQLQPGSRGQRSIVQRHFVDHDNLCFANTFVQLFVICTWKGCEIRQQLVKNGEIEVSGPKRVKIEEYGLHVAGTSVALVGVVVNLSAAHGRCH